MSSVIMYCGEVAMMQASRRISVKVHILRAFGNWVTGYGVHVPLLHMRVA